jgi:hypothetical protein
MVTIDYGRTATGMLSCFIIITVEPMSNSTFNYVIQSSPHGLAQILRRIQRQCNICGSGS